MYTCLLCERNPLDGMCKVKVRAVLDPRCRLSSSADVKIILWGRSAFLLSVQGCPSEASRKLLSNIRSTCTVC